MRKTWPLLRRLLIQSLCLLLFLEIGVRCSVPWLPGNYRSGLIWSNHPVFGRYHVPGSSAWIKSPEFTAFSAINQVGLRDIERPYAKPADAFRILVLGDSFVEAVQVPFEQSFVPLLERKLKAAAGARQIEVINGGVMAFSTDQALLFLEQEGSKYQPDLVVLLFLDSDVRGNSRVLNSDSHLAGRKPYFELEDSDQLRPVGLQERSWIASAGETSIRAVGGYSRLVAVFNSGIWEPALLRLAATSATPSLPRDFEVYSRTVAPDWEAAWQLTERLIDRVKSTAEANGAGFLLVFAGEPYQVDLNYFDEHVRRFGLRREDWDPELSNRRVEQMAARNGWRLLDLLPPFRAALTSQGTVMETQYINYQQQPGLHFPIDGHWKAAGHEVAASEIAKYLAEHPDALR
jgi:hypothetical protein